MRLAVWTALVAATGALTAVALAAGSGSERARSVTVASFDSGAVSSSCAGSKRLTLAGVKASTNRRRGLVVSGLRPRGSRGARAAATNVFANPARLKVTAYCARTGPLRVVSRRTKLAPAKGSKPTAGKVTARCPAGTSVRLGGFRADVAPQPSGPSIVVNAMRRAGARGLTVAAVNTGTKEGRLEAIAGCGPGPRLDAISSPITGLAGGGRATAHAHCPSGEQLVFGGFQTSRNDGAGPYLTMLARPAPNRWLARAFQFKRPDATLMAIAYLRLSIPSRGRRGRRPARGAGAVCRGAAR